MAGLKTGSSQWCILRNNRLLRDVLLYQLDKLNRDKTWLASKIGVEPYRVYNYFGYRTKGLTQFQLVNAAELLKVKIDIDIKIVT